MRSSSGNAVVNRKALRFLPCFLLAALVFCQAAQATHHTCVDGHALVGDRLGQTVLDLDAERAGTGSPLCVACAFASGSGALLDEPAPAAAPPGPEGLVAEHPSLERSPAIAGAPLPRPPPPHA